MDKRFYSLLTFLVFILTTATLNAQQLPSHDRIQSELITMDSDGLMLKHSFTIDAPIREVWPYFTETKLYTQWAAPVAEVNFKINGTIRANYTPGANLGDDGTITIHILNYIPEKLITLQSEIPDSFPAFFKENEKDFYNVIEFKESGTGETEIISYGLGYKNNDQFKQMIGFFAQGNIDYYQKLIDLVE